MSAGPVGSVELFTALWLFGVRRGALIGIIGLLKTFRMITALWGSAGDRR